ncbi:MAG: DMT family transporter [Bacteriovoracaceae bacterium]|nr:DMT family transporter [Bacteriovoracaceae bacterium]
MQEKNLGLIYAVITAVFWAILAIALKVSLKTLNAMTIVWFRFIFSASALLIYFIWKKHTWLSFKKFPTDSVLAGLFLGLNYYGFMKGIEYTSPSVAQIIIQIGPLLLALAGLALYNEKLNPIQIFGFVIALVGFFLFYSDGLDSVSLGPDYQTGITWTAVAAVSWTIYALFQKNAIKTVSPQEINFIIYIVAGSIFCFLADYQSLTTVPLDVWPLIIFLGLNTLIAYGALAEALKRAPSNEISIIITVNPILTIIIMEILAFFNVGWINPEDISWRGYLGAFLVILGAITVVSLGKKYYQKLVLKNNPTSP